MARDIDDDAYVAELLKQDAKKATKTYELVGIDAFNPRRMNSRAPRPNKNFLQHLIRQTDSHNTALLAKEAEESRARLRKMDRDRKKAGDCEKDNDRGLKERLATAANDGNGHDTIPSRRRDRDEVKTSDSDPLEAIVGPLPPPPEPTVRSKGRGAYKSNNMGIESRFSSTYDPSTDVGVNSDVEDDWGDALEALRDRARWQQQGADRLKAAGFTDAQVRKWERGDTQNEEDVIWTRKGQAREWDRGKVLDEEGDVELKADFGRLK
ncbi:hypothetical protein ACET3X_005012 [Alternaria dauci]|uniref:Pre-mRNA-splicing factor 38B n=1 Tax=Alternaria dauci TaxID=48095 RepID=A0ABR3UJN7_9PLEO